MADNEWSESTCRAGTWWYGIPGSGSWYWTARFGQYWCGGVIYQRYAFQGYECSSLGPPVKAYGYMSEFNGEGTWFLGGAIVYRYDTRAWHTYFGDWGQTAGRLTDEPIDVSGYVEQPQIPGDWSELPKWVQPKAPKISKEMKALAA